MAHDVRLSRCVPDAMRVVRSARQDWREIGVPRISSGVVLACVGVMTKAVFFRPFARACSGMFFVFVSGGG